MRVRVPVEDLVDSLTPVGSGAGGTARGTLGAPDTNVDALRLSRTRTVPASLDLRGARVEEALDALERYLEDASLAGLSKVTIIHGLGTGALRDAVRSAAAAHPLTGEVRPGGQGEGGDGATIVGVG
jgi:DNA mismatch repair protein MutS2